MEEKELVEKSKAGDLDSFNRLVLLYQKKVYNFCLRLTGNVDAAEDMAQETFISAWRGIKGLRGENFGYWLLRIARNACYDYFRSLRRKPYLSLEAIPDITPARYGNPEQQALKDELGEDISRALETLSPEFKEVVVLSDILGYNYEEISKILNCSLGTVRSRLSRGRSRLRVFLLERGTFSRPRSSV